MSLRSPIVDRAWAVQALAVSTVLHTLLALTPVTIAAGGQSPVGAGVVFATGDVSSQLSYLRRPVSVASAGETVILAWTAIDPVQGDQDIYQARSTDRGETWSEPAPLNVNAATDGGNRADHSPWLATDGQGNWVAVWIGPRASYGPPFAGSDPVIARSTDDGVTWLPGSLLQPMPTGGFDALPVVEWLGGTTWGAAWSSSSPGGDSLDVLFSTSIDGGVSWQNGTVISGAAGSAGTKAPAGIATDGTGTVLVGWSTSLSVGLPTADVRVTRSEDFGESWSAPMFVVAPDAAVRRDEHLSIARAKRGWVASWVTDAAFGSNTSTPAVVAAFSDDGLTWSEPAALQQSDPTYGVTDTTMAASIDGRICVAWAATGHAIETGSTSTGTDFDILACESADGGDTWTEPRVVNGGAVGDSRDDRRPVVAMTVAGWVAGWQFQMNAGAPAAREVAVRGFGADGPCGLTREDDDCDGDLAADACAIALEWLPDCNGNGVLDGCDIAAGLNSDCDHDGTPDACAIAEGLAADCNSDGVPDDCQLGGYVHGEGPTDVSIGVGTGSWDALTLECFRVRAGVEVMTGVNIAWQYEFVDLPDQATLGVWSDPDGDGAPSDAALLFALDFVPDASSPGAVQTVKTPPLQLGDPGENVFVGVLMSAPPSSIGAVRVDSASVGGTTWVGVAESGSADLSAIAETMSIRPFGYWFASVANWGLDIIAASTFDANGDGVIDSCVTLGDLDGNGVVDGADLGLLLASWGRCAAPCAADLNNDGVVDGSDLGLLLGEWG